MKTFIHRFWSIRFIFNVIIILFGIIGFTFLGVRDYPAIDPPNINVRTSYSGANADIIESQITEPLEKAINGIAGIKNITYTPDDKPAVEILTSVPGFEPDNIVWDTFCPSMLYIDIISPVLKPAFK